MIKKENVSLEEMIEDMKDMLGTPEMYEHTLSTMVLNEDEKLIFQRAALHIKRGNPDKFVIKKAYEILVLKSFYNKNTNKHDTQNIKGNKPKLLDLEEEEKQGVVEYIKDNLEKIIVFIIILIIVSKFL